MNLEEDGRGEAPAELPKATRTPPMIHAEFDKGITPIRHGQRFNIGYGVSGTEKGFYVAPRGLGGAKKASWYPLDDNGWVSAWSDFASREPWTAEDYWKQLEPKTQAGARVKAPVLPLLTIPTIPGREIVDAIGLITASAVMSRNMLSDLGSDISSAFGGNLEGIEKAIRLCTDQVRQQMYEQARNVGADHVVGLSVRLETVSDKAQAVLMAGTAVHSRPTGALVTSP